MFAQTATKEFSTLTLTKAARPAIHYLGFGYKGSVEPPILWPMFQLFFFTFRTVVDLCPTPLLTLSVPHKRYDPFLCF